MDFWDGKRVLVTGNEAAGKKIVNELLKRNASVVLLAKGKPKVDADIVSGSLDDYQAVERCINEYYIDTVLHLETKSATKTGAREIFESVIKGTWNLLEACRHHGHVKRIVISGNFDSAKEPMLEDMQTRDSSETANGCCCILARSYAMTYGLNVEFFDFESGRLSALFQK